MNVSEETFRTVAAMLFGAICEAAGGREVTRDAAAIINGVINRSVSLDQAARQHLKEIARAASA